MYKKTYWTCAGVLALAIMLWHCPIACAASSASWPADLSAEPRVDDRSVPTARVLFANTIEAGKGTASKPHGQGDGAVHDDGDKKDGPQDAPDEVQKLKERILDVQNQGKLGFRKIIPCSSAEGFGIYSPLEPSQKVQRIVFYCEPSNVSTLKSGDRYVIDCAVDCILMDTSGRVLGGKQNFLRINRVSRSPIMDLFFKFDIALKKPLDRPVLLKTVLHDKIKNASVSATKKISIEGPHTKPGRGDI